MRLAILDYSSSQVDIVDNVPDLKTNEEIENYLVEVLEYNSDEIYWMDLSRGSINYLTPDSYSFDEEHAERFNVIADIHKKYDAFVQEHKHEPKYVSCRVKFYNEEDGMDVTIKLLDEMDEQDELIFFYCTGVDDLVRLCYVDTEDFDLIKVYEFTDEA